MSTILLYIYIPEELLREQKGQFESRFIVISSSSSWSLWYFGFVVGWYVHFNI